MKIALTVALALAAVACGASKQDPEPLESARHVQPHAVSRHANATGSAEHGDAEHAEHAEHAEGAEHGEMAKLPAPVAKLHDTLAPRWHAEHGPKRVADTCAAAGELDREAGAIALAPPPTGATAATWAAATGQLVDAVHALDATCKAHDATAFEPAFERVHTSFHDVLEAAEHAER